MGKSVKNIAGRAGLAAVTGGLSEFTRKDPFGGVNNPLGIRSLMFGNPSAPSLNMAGHNPAEVLAQNGGAPLLANIAMGASIDDSLAGFLGIRKEEFLDALAGRNTTINPQDLTSIMNVRNQLKSIQEDRNLRQKAVDKVIADFPNIAQQSAQARLQSGQEFDEVTKGYMDQALRGTAAKFAAGGNLSSGAMNEAVARVGAEQGMNKLNFMNERQGFDYNQRLQALNARLNEVNALRDFQNSMMGVGVQQGFSANQASLQRQFQGQAMNAEMQMKQREIEQSGRNAMFGAVGSLGGSFLGAKMLGGSMLGGSLFGSPSAQSSTGIGGIFNQNAPTTFNTSYGRILGGK